MPIFSHYSKRIIFTLRTAIIEEQCFWYICYVVFDVESECKVCFRLFSPISCQIVQKLLYCTIWLLLKKKFSKLRFNSNSASKNTLEPFF